MFPGKQYPSFGTMTADEAQEHFEWFVAQSDIRVTLLSRAFEEEVGVGLVTEKGSLIPLWEWLTPHMEVDQTNSAPALTLHTAELPNRQLTAGSLCLAVDTGFFLAKLFAQASNAVSWGLWTKTRDYYFQRPVLKGFAQYPLVPHDLVVANAWRVVRGETKTDLLLNSYERWERRLQ